MCDFRPEVKGCADNLLTAPDARVVNVSYGKGSLKPTSPLIEIFGFVPEEHKVVITCLLSQKKVHEAIETLEQKLNFNEPNTGIAFSVNLDNFRLIRRES